MREFTVLTSRHGQLLGTLEWRESNRLHDQIRSVARATRTFEEEGRNAMIALFEHDDPGVREWAAYYVLESDPAQARPVLERLSHRTDLHGLNAKYILQEYDAGNLTFP
ncbi:MAG: DUF2019 domain-containing protein [Chloroflexota bacterium]